MIAGGTSTSPMDPRFVAAVHLIERTGAKDFRVGFSEEKPVVWHCYAGYKGGRGEAAAGLDPVQAVLRLCEQLIDGGRCVHCNRPAGFDADFDKPEIPIDAVCWYRYDPEMATFRRGCE